MARLGRDGSKRLCLEQEVIHPNLKLHAKLERPMRYGKLCQSLCKRSKTSNVARSFATFNEHRTWCTSNLELYQFQSLISAAPHSRL